MSDKDLNEFKADHSGGDVVKGAEVMDPVTPAGGEIKKKKADVKKAVDPKADTLDVKPPMAEESEEAEGEILEEISIDESIQAMFEGMDLSEEFKEKASMVFEAAVNAAAHEKASSIVEKLEEDFQNQLSESVDEAMEEIVEHLDGYLDYIVAEWMEENEVAIESGMKVEMAESFMEGLKGLFYEHNVEIDEESISVVEELEAQIAELEEAANKAINESIELSEEISDLYAEKVFNESIEGLTTTQAEKLRVLSERLDTSDLDSYAESLETLKESFFKQKTAQVIKEDVEEEEPLLEETAPSRTSEYDSVNSIVSFLNSKNS